MLNICRFLINSVANVPIDEELFYNYSLRTKESLFMMNFLNNLLHEGKDPNCVNSDNNKIWMVIQAMRTLIFQSIIQRPITLHVMNLCSLYNKYNANYSSLKFPFMCMK